MMITFNIGTAASVAFLYAFAMVSVLSLQLTIPDSAEWFVC